MRRLTDYLSSQTYDALNDRHLAHDRNIVRTDDEVLHTFLQVYTLPSEALWRYCEYLALRDLTLTNPILELGCGNGVFSALTIGDVDLAIDKDPRAVARARQVGLYDRVECLDARNLDPGIGPFNTILANCVLEHIAELPHLLSRIGRVMSMGSQLVATVPLVSMNDYLLFRNGRWIRWRQASLQHENLTDILGWRALLMDAGFAEVTATPYLWGGTCHLWDLVDGIGCIGYGRLRVGIICKIAYRILPHVMRNRMSQLMEKWIIKSLPKLQARGEPCAVVLIATRDGSTGRNIKYDPA